MTIEHLEHRRLLSLALLGPATDVPGSASTQYDLAVAGNGESIIARVSDLSLEVLRYAPTGEPLGAPLTIVSGKTVYDVSASMDADGDAVVAWVEKEAVGQSVEFARISKDGVASAPVILTTADTGGPAISMDSAGGFFVGWTQDNSSTGKVDVQIQAFHANGAPRASRFTAQSIGDDSSLYGFTLDANPDGSGAAFAAGQFAFMYDDISPPSNVIFGRVSTTALIGAGGQIDSGQGESDPSVAVNADGSFEIAYEQSSIGPTDYQFGASLSVQRFNAAGVAQGDRIILSPVSDEEPFQLMHDASAVVNIDALADGGFIAAFTRSAPRVDPGGTEMTCPILVERFSAAGVADAGGPVQVGTHTIDSYYGPIAPQIGVDADGVGTIAFVTSLAGVPIRVARVAPDDVAYVQSGILYAFGTAGADSISVDVVDSNVIVTRGASSRTFSAAEVNVLLADGFEGDDTLTNNTVLKATLRGGDGNDSIFGGSGDDRIIGGVGDDELWGNDGSDRLYGDDGFDSLYGNGGNDRLEGGAQSDHMRGNGGRDHLFGNGGNDRMYGGEGGDWMYGQPGNDLLAGEGGNDHLYGDDGSGDDTLAGGAGNDWLISLDGAIDHLFGDGGHDSANADEIDLLTSIEVIT